MTEQQKKDLLLSLRIIKISSEPYGRFTATTAGNNTITSHPDILRDWKIEEIQILEKSIKIMETKTEQEAKTKEMFLNLLTSQILSTAIITQQYNFKGLAKIWETENAESKRLYIRYNKKGSYTQTRRRTTRKEIIDLLYNKTDSLLKTIQEQYNRINKLEEQLKQFEPEQED